MKRTIFYLASAALAIMVIAGCSSNDSILGSSEQELGGLLLSNGPLTNDGSDNSEFEAPDDSKLITLKATVRQANDSFNDDGCWYLETDDGKRYEPVFGAKVPQLNVGMVVLAVGILSENTHTECNIGPVFYVKDFKVLYSEERQPEIISIEARFFNHTDSPEFGNCPYLETAKGDRYQPLFKGKDPSFKDGTLLKVTGYIDPEMNSDCNVGPVFVVVEYYALPEADNNDKTDYLERFKGTFRLTARGCSYLELKGTDSPNEGESKIELAFGDDDLFKIKDGTLMEVAGYFSLLDISNCNVGPLFNVVEYKIIAGSTPDGFDGTGKK